MDKTAELFSLKENTALITGASHGIGMELALTLANAGAQVCFNCRSGEHLSEALKQYQSKGVKAHGFVCDVTDEPAVKDMISQIEKECGSIDILVNNAGIIERKNMLEMSSADFERVVKTDLVGPFIVSKAVLPGMIKKGSGKIINLCSLLSEVGREDVSSYAAAKGGLKLLTKSICAEFGSYNIQCNAIAPGYIEDEQTAPLRTPLPDGQKNPFETYLMERTPARRWGQVSDLAGPVLFLASKASDFVNGQILIVDGGILSSFGRPSAAQ